MASRSRRLILVASFLLWPLCAAAQSWPVKPIRVITGYAAGASVDITCRVAMDALSAELGQPIIIENRPGNASIIGSQAAAHTTPDGYNFLCGAASGLVTNAFTFKSLPYNPEKDFVPVGLIGTNPFFILVSPSVPAKTLPELIALDKAKPGSLSFASDGTKNFSGLVGAFLNKRAGTHFIQVSYTSMAQGLQDAMAGRIQIIMQPPATARQYIESGKLRPIAVSSLQPAAGFESVPPVADSFPGFEFVGWVCLVAPAGTPADIIRRMNKGLTAALAKEVVIKRLATLGMTAKSSSPEQAAAFIAAERKRWAEVMRAINFKPD